MTVHDTPTAALDVHTAEAIPEAARAEVERLLMTGDLFRYTSDNAPVALLEAEFAQTVFEAHQEDDARALNSVFGRARAQHTALERMVVTDGEALFVGRDDGTIERRSVET